MSVGGNGSGGVPSESLRDYGRAQVPKGHGAQVPAFEDADGRTGAEISRVVRAAGPYPAATANAALDPDARLQAVRAQEGR